ncbi:hypothetical protein [Kribbella italica]|uniref:Uncharacterized protein n=1 Tax=Kribbella italica TaxID=1540520 RepID=A0A7W9MRT0_9ACTN|nr:hypothetical protein [Kribbella italica]MBB5833447.1 hypothetical protein [Kribbella italica]
MTNENTTITVEDLAGLEALPTGTEFRGIGRFFSLARTSHGVGLANSSTEYTTNHIANTYLPAEITNPETLGSFAGVGDRVRIVREYEVEGRGEFDGELGEVAEVHPGQTWSYSVKTDTGPLIGAMVVELTDTPKPTEPVVATAVKVGDRVRIVREFEEGTSRYDGRPGTLTRIDPDSQAFPYSVTLDDGDYDIFFQVEPLIEPGAEPTLEYPLVNDAAGLNALPGGSIVVPLAEGYSPRMFYGAGFSDDQAGWRCFADNSFDLTDQTLELALDEGVLVVYQP